MGTFLHDPAVCKYDNFVGVTNGGKAVGNHNGRPLPRLEEPVEGLLHHPFAFCVQCGGCLVKQQDLRVPHNRPGDCNSLLLSPR